MKKFTELCLSGAANKGISYIGAMRVLDDRNLLDIKKFVGVSIGSLVGVCYIIGYKPDELMTEVNKKDLSEFEDVSLESVFTNGAVLEGETYRLWVWELLSKKINPMTSIETVNKLFDVEIIIGATSLDSGEDGLEFFSVDTTPEIPIYYAILASMTIPFIFPPVVYNGKRYVDGGVLNNFPMDLLSENAIGFRVKSSPVTAELTNYSYISKIIQLMTTRIRKLGSCKGNAITINNTDFGRLSFSLSLDDKMTLYTRGYNTVIEFLEIKTKEEADKVEADKVEAKKESSSDED